MASIVSGPTHLKACPTTVMYSWKSVLASTGADDATEPTTRCGYFNLTSQHMELSSDQGPSSLSSLKLVTTHLKKAARLPG